MLSRAEPGSRRARAEGVCRGVAVAALAALAWRAFHPALASAAASTRVSALGRLLPTLTRRPVMQLHVDADRLPAAGERAWLAALRRSGMGVTWSATRALPPVVASSEPAVAPGGRRLLRLRAEPGESLVVTDRDGDVTSLHAGVDGGATFAGTLYDSAVVAGGGSGAVVADREVLQLRPVLVAGRVGWEAKFVLAALEEAGWTVEARLRLAPGAVVAQKGSAPLDTAHYSAIVLLDSVAGPSPASVSAFVRSGGGMIAAGDALTRRALVELVGTRRGERLRAGVGALESAEPRRGLSAVALVGTPTDGAVLERRDGHAVVVARRVGAGRAMAVGYTDSWRWRMQGAGDAVEQHRAWWSSLLSSVSHASVAAAPRAAGLDEAPLASMVAAFGAPTAAPMVAAGGRPWLDALLFAVAIGALLAESASRRLRGAP